MMSLTASKRCHGSTASNQVSGVIGASKSGQAALVEVTDYDPAIINTEWYESYVRAGLIGYFGGLDPSDLEGFWTLYFEFESAEVHGHLSQTMSEFGVSCKDEFGAIWAAFMARHFRLEKHIFLGAMLGARQRHHMRVQERCSMTEVSERETAPCSYFDFCDMSAASAAWLELGLDVDSYMQQFFNTDAEGFARAGGFWSARLAADPLLATRFAADVMRAKETYLTGRM